MDHESLVVDVPVEHAGRTATLAVFDLDRTLLAGSSLVPFARHLTRSGALPRRTLVDALLRDLRYRHRGSTDGSVSRVRQTVTKLATGRAYEPLRLVAEEVGARLVGEMSPSARMLVHRHLLAADFCVVLSASPQELVDAVVYGLGAHRGVGTRVEVVDGHLTGELVGPFCYGGGKLERLRMELGDVELEAAWAYADSMSDLPLLERAAHAVAVRPDRSLRRIARERSWPILDF